MKKWTSHKVKAELPDVLFAQGRNSLKQTGRLSGRKNLFATLTSPCGMMHWEVSWDTLAIVLSQADAYIIV